jgi:hypothetical protein
MEPGLKLGRPCELISAAVHLITAWPEARRGHEVRLADTSTVLGVEPIPVLCDSVCKMA